MAHMFTTAVVPAGTRAARPPASAPRSRWASRVARRAHDSSGPGGCIRRHSLTTQCRYGSAAASPLTAAASISACALDWTSGCSAIRASTHSSRMATVSVPRKIISHRTATMSSSSSLSSPSSPNKTSTKSPSPSQPPYLASLLVLCSSMILETNTLTLDASALLFLLTPWTSRRRSRGRWSPQLKVPSSSYPCPTISSSSDTAPAPSSPRPTPNTLAMTLSRLARCSSRLTPTAPSRAMAAATRRTVSSPIALRRAASLPGASACADARRRSRRQYPPCGANPMARWNMSSAAASFTGRSANAAPARISRAVSGWLATTNWVSPTENAMRRVAPRVDAARLASARCGFGPANASRTPRGPGMAAAPWPPDDDSAHATPPGWKKASARKRRARRRQAW
ncbi:Os03g0603200, partial [Oryza sativa Japonica Group]